MKKEIFTDLSRRACYICIYYHHLLYYITDMAKKRKLNSKNPIYNTATKTDEPVIDKRIKMCDAPIRNASGKKTGRTAAVYAVYYKN